MPSSRHYQEVYKCTPAEFVAIGAAVADRFKQQRGLAKTRGIDFLFTLPEWWKIWNDSGYWPQRGPAGYVMCRRGDIGPYAPWNVFIGTAKQNKRDGIAATARAAAKNIPVTMDGDRYDPLAEVIS